MRRTFVPVVVAVLVGLVALDRGPMAIAQGATPARWAVPPPEDCTVAPRSLEAYSASVGTPHPPEPHPDLMYDDEASLPGRPADPQTEAAIKAWAWVHVACLNAGDYRRNDALVTDEAFVRLYAPSDPELLGEALARAAGTPEPLPPGEQRPVDVRRVLVQQDGRVGAVVDYCGEANFYLFERVGDRWLYDD